MEELRRDVAQLGFRAEIQGRTVGDIAAELLHAAKEGLAARANLDGSGVDETHFLRTLEESVRRGKTPAEDLLDRYHGEWAGDISRIFKDCAY